MHYKRIFHLFGIVLLSIAGCTAEKTREPQGAPPLPEVMQFAGMPVSGELTSSALTGVSGPTTFYNGKEVPSLQVTSLDNGLILPDGKGGVIHILGNEYARQAEGYVNAREFKLKIRELAEQLIAGVHDDSLRGAVALPVSFVNVDNLDQTSSFGRVIAEQLYYEFNQRGFATKEYRGGDTIALQGSSGDFYLSRNKKNVTIPHSGTLVVTGTYYYDNQAIIVNARLLRPKDGRVLRTANLVLQNNPMMKRMLSKTGVKPLPEGKTQIKDYRRMLAPKVTNPIDKGEDIH